MVSCQGEKIPEIVGDFQGTFSVDYENSETVSGSFDLTLQENGSQYWYSELGNMPEQSSGSYEVFGSTIRFSDGVCHGGGFDYFMVLNDKYSYSYDGDHLVLSKTNYRGTYTYSLYRK